MNLHDFGPRGLPHTLFTKAHIPHWQPEWGSRYRTLPGTFPTDKSPMGEIMTRLPLMADGLMHVDTDPNVAVIAAYPMKIEYWSVTRFGKSVKREHLPDIAVKMKDGRVVFLDYIPVNEQREMNWIQRRTHQLREHFEALHNCSYAVHDERCVRKTPLYDNIKAMWAHKPARLDPPELELVRLAMRRALFPSSLGDLKKALHADPDLVDLFARHDVGGVDLVFTAAMQLCFGGELDIDLSKPFSAASIVSNRNLRGA